MGFFSKKARRDNKITIFTALKLHAKSFVVSAVQSIAQLRFLSRMYRFAGTHAVKIFALLLVVAIGGLSIHQAQSQYDERDQKLGVKNTLLVYPSTISDSAWSGVEEVLAPDLGEDALYQEFSARNSAYIPLSLPTTETTTGGSAEDTSSQNESTPVADADPSEMETGTSSEEAVTEPSDPQTNTAAPIETEDEVETAPVEQPEQESQTQTETPEVEASVSEPESVPEATSEPVVIRQATESFFAFLSTVTELFPFMNSEVAEAPAQEETSSVSETSVPQPEDAPEAPVTGTEAQGVVETPVTPEPEQTNASSTPAEEVSVPEVSTNVTGTSSASSTQEVVDGSEEIESNTPPLPQVVKTIELSDFSTPELKRGEFITSTQLRMSLGASYETQASSAAPVLEIVYKTASSSNVVGTVLLDGEVSNALNGGYFLFALPQIAGTGELAGASIEVTYTGDVEHLDGLYLDAAWLQIDVERLDKQLLFERLARDILKRMDNPEIYTLLTEEKDFTREELPLFSLKYNSQRNIAVRLFRDLIGRKLAEVEEVSFIHKDVGDIGVTPKIYVTDEGLFNIQIEEEDKDRLRPGEYTVEITVDEGGSTFTDSFTFQWGLLSINSDQTTYALGDTTTISMGALSPNGNTICDANLSLYVIDPEDVLTKVPVTPSGLCNGNNVVDVPDYSAQFVPEIVGEYEMYLERIDTDGTIIAHTLDTFHVKETLAFELTRNGPSRIFPKATYPMELTLTAKEDWEGILVEKVPAVFEIRETIATQTQVEDMYELSWDVSLLAGESKTFSYQFDAPDISPYLYTVGTARLEGKNSEEIATTTDEQVGTTTEEIAPEVEEQTSAPETSPEIITEPEPTIPEVPETPEPVIPDFGSTNTSTVESAVSTTVPAAEEATEDTTSEWIDVDPETNQLQTPEPQETVLASRESNVIFEEHRQWQIASDATGNLIVFWNSGSAIPAGWTCLSCGSGTFYQRFPMGGASYNTTGGATTHTHTATGVVNASAAVNTENNGSGEISIPSHSHLYTPTISSVSNLPAYRQFRVIQSNSAGDPTTIPAGAIMIFDSATLPSGWTRLSALDGRYPRGENSIANGGSNTHTHSITGNTTAATNVSTLNSRTGGSQVNGAADNHAHSVSSATASQSNEPPFIEVVFATAGTATSTPVGAIAMWSDEPPAQWIDQSSDPADPFYGRFIKGATSYGTTGGSDTHSHPDIFGITSGAPTVLDNARSGSSGSSNTHTHAIDVTNFTTSSNLPPYLTVVYGKKLGAVPVYTQSRYKFFANENAITPTDAWPAGGAELLENEPITAESGPVANAEVVRLRMQVGVSNSTSTTDTFKLQFATTTAFCADATLWTDVGNATSSAVWRGYDNAGVNDGVALATSTLSSTTVLATYEETSPTAIPPASIGVNGFGEWDFVLQQNGAESGTNYCFRMVENDGTPLFAYTEYPMLVTNQAPAQPTLQKLFDNEKVADTTPAFEFSAADAEGEDLQYQIQVDDAYDFSSTVIDHNTLTNATLFENLATPADKDPFTNGELIRYNNATALSNGTTYYWRVRARDTNGSNQWGSWSTIQSFTIDTSVTVSTWFQTTEEQFETNTLLNVEAVASDQMQLIAPFATGTVYSDPISFEEGELGTAWGDFVFADTETASDIKYTIQYFDGSDWTDIPDSVLAGNSTGFDTSPVSLLGVDKTVYSEIRIEANLTNSGASPSIQSWSVDWDYLIETPTISAPFANEKVGTTTPTFEFTTTDPQNDSLVYQLEWSTNYDFTGATTRTSDTHAGFTNVDSGGDTSPFNSGDDIRFKIQAGDALTNGTTYWWRVRARDPLGSNTYSFYTVPRSFTVDTSVTVSTWFQTAQSQFDNNLTSGLRTLSSNSVTVATTTEESIIVYAEGTVTTPRYRRWSGSAWGAELSALNVGATINWVVTKSSPMENEYITGTLGSDGDVNLQVFKNGAWGNLEEISTAVSNVDMRGFDIAYETSSGDALAVACDGNADPSYHIWNGTSWSDEGDINISGSNACGWIRLISDPTSDEIIMVVRDILGTNYEAMVWDGSSWGNSVTWGSMAEDINEGIAASYEASGNQAVVAVSNGGSSSFTWRAWNGSSWTAAANATIGDDFEWGSMAADVGTDNMVLCYIDQDNDIGVIRWTGAAWTGQTEMDTGGNDKTARPVDCMFEVGGSRDGNIMVVYSDTTAVRYRSWNGSSWAGEASISTITDASTVQLQRTGAQLLQVVAYDDVNDRYDYSGWNGTSWSTRQALETNGSVGASPFKEPFMIAPQNPGTFGTIIGDPLINFHEGSGPYWQQLSWNDTTPGSSDILYQVEYYDGDSWELIPDSLIPGNSVGTSTSPLNLSSVLPASTYDQIRPVANLSCIAGSCPTLSDWTITWAAGINISGTAQQYDQSTNVTSGTVSIAVNGVLQAGKTGTISGGVWSIPNVNVAQGDIVTLFISGVADSAEAVTVAAYDGVGDMTGITLYQRHLVIGSDDGGIITNASLALYDFTNTEDIFFDVNSGNDLSVCATTGCSDARLLIKSGTTFKSGSGGNVTTFNFENNGTLELDGNTMRVGGSWDNNATTSMGTSTVIFTATSTEAIPAPWYNASWLYRVPITVQSSELGSDVTNFPVHVDLSDLGASFFNNVTSDGGDIRVTAGDAVTELPRELVSINTGTDTGEIYFRANSLSSSADTTFYIYYGNNAANDYATNATYGAENVWSNGYEAVYHMEQNPSGGAPQYVDSTGNSSGTAVNMESGDRVAGIAGSAAEVDGVNERIETNFNQSLLSSTWSIFLDADGTQAACDGVMFSRGTGVNGINAGACGATNRLGYHWENLAATSWNFAGGAIYPTNQWYMASMVVEPTQATLYAHTQSGVSSGSNVQTHTLSTINNLDFGWDSFGVDRSFDGTMDEARLSSVARSADWLSAEYTSIADPDAFYAVAAEESYASSLGTDSVFTLEDGDGVLNFYNVTFGEGSGDAAWGIADTLDADNTLSVQYGTLERDAQEVFIGRNLTIGASGLWSGSGTTTFDGTLASVWSDATASKQNIGHAVIDGTNKTVTLGSNARAASVTIGANDTFDLSSSNYDIIVHGNWNNQNTFNARSGDVTFAGTSAGQVVTVGGDNFYNLIFNGTGGSWSFTESTLGVNNDLTLAGGTVTFPTGTTTITGSFTNTGGTFAHNNGLLVFNSGTSETITLNGGTFTNALYDVRFQGSGSWTFTETRATTSNQFRIAQGTVTLPSDTLAVGDSFLNTGGTFAHNNGTVRFFSAESETIDTNASFNNLTFAGSGSWAFVDASVTVLGDITVASGSVTLPSGTLSLGGSLSNQATLVHNSGTVLFNSTDTGEFIVLGSSALYNMTFNNANGGWTIASSATSTNNVVLTAANSFTLASGQQLNVGGSFTNAVGGSATTWTDSVLSLYGGSYAINTKTTGGDTYGTLQVAASADVQMWNSSANAYAVHLDGSLYSQDHNAVDGNLYIWGAYARNSGTEYWSYDTDFDGASLAGSERQVHVRFAPNASAAITSAALSLEGTSGAVTTVDVQSAGYYGVSLTDATIDARHYSFENLNMFGLRLNGTTDIASLEHGYFNLSAEFGASLTLSTTTIDANPGLQITDVTFDSSLSTSSSGSNGEDTFLFFDDFADGTIDTNKWTKDIELGAISETGGYLRAGGGITTGNYGHTSLGSEVGFNSFQNNAVIWRGRNSVDGIGEVAFRGDAGSNTGYKARFDARTGDNGQAFLEPPYSGWVFSNGTGTCTSDSNEPTANQWYTYQVTANSTNFQMYRNNTLMRNCTDATFAGAGEIALQNHYGSYTDYDWVAVRPFVSPEPTHSTWSAVEEIFSGVYRKNHVIAGTSAGAQTGYVLPVTVNFGSGSDSGQNVYCNSECNGDFSDVRFREADGTELSFWKEESYTASSSAVFWVKINSIPAAPGTTSFYMYYGDTGNGYNVAVPDASEASSYVWFRNHSGNFDGEAFDNDNGDPGVVRWDDSSLVFTISGTVFADDGVTPLAGGTCNGVSTPVRVLVEGGGTYDGSCSGANGSFSIPNVTVIGDPTVTVFLNGASGGQKAVTVTKTPTADITGLDLYANRVITRHEDTAPMTIADMVHDSSVDSDILFSVSSSTLSLVPNSELFVWASTTFTPGGAVTLNSGGTGTVYDGSLHIAGGASFVGNGTTTYTVGGTFRMDAGASFEAASSTVLMTATTTGKAITVADGETALFNTLRFTGSNGGWNINGDILAFDTIEIATGTVTGTGDITLPNGSLYGDGLLSMGGGTTTLAQTNTYGGVQGWTFHNLSLGNGAVVGTTTPASTATTTISGVLSIQNAHYLDAGSSVFNLSGSDTVFVENGTFLEDTSTVRYSGGSGANILSTTYYNLDLNAGAGTPTYTATGLGIAVANDLTIGGSAATQVNFATNDTVLDVNGDVFIRANGTLIASETGAFTVAGNWDNDGTFQASNGTLTFDSSSTATIAAGASPFGNVSIDGLGSFTLTEHATATGAWNLVEASDFTVATGQRLAVGGTFSNELGGGITSWDGSTLHLFGGGNYTINDKNISDAYGVLSVGADTDIRMWNSSADDYAVAPSGSLYSQDHDSVDGDLYIYGNYPGNGGTDHWSYATDFDGTPLSSGNERQANVYFDDATERVAVFTANGTFTPPAGVTDVDVLVVGGGGGGGTATSFANAGAGGGGGGGVVYEENFSVTPLSPLAVTVGSGGSAGPSGNNPGTNGGNSSFATLVAQGGGGGRGGNGNGLNGGSGGGARGGNGGAATQPGSASGGYGNAGGNIPGSVAGAGATGGGGAGGAAENLAGTAGEKGGNGGPGLAFTISGASVYYGAGGGGGAAQTNTPVGQGGIGGGGNGGNNTTAPTAGAANTGAGGGGGNNARAGAAGGSGIVIVRYEGGASAEITNGGLSVIGESGASTTIQSIGSAPYSLSIGGTASTTWTRYAVADIDSAGLTFTGTPNVVTLSNGSFEVSQNNGSAITVDGSVITANPAKTFTNNVFTSTGGTTYNVTATGTALSSWRFTNHAGNLAGEAFDVDPDGDPGYIVWDDSAASITISGNVYSDEGSTVSTVCDGTTNNIHLRVAGLTSYTTSCNATTGLYTISGVTYSPGDALIVYIDGETQKGATVSEDPISNINNMHIYENRVIVRHENTDPISIADMTLWDSSDDADIPFTAVDAATDTLTLPANRKLIVWTGKEFRPNGNVTLSGGGGGAAYDGTFEAYAGAIVTFAASQQHSVGGSFIFGNGATFDAGQSTTTFTTSGAGRTIDINEEGFYNVAFTGSGSWTLSDATLAAHDVFITSGALTLGTGTTTISGTWNNTGGSFNVNGSTFVFTATTAGKVVRAGGSNFAGLVFNGTGGAWSMTDTNATSTGSFTVASGTVSLPSGVFAVGGDFRNEGGTLIHNTSEVVLTNGTSAALRASGSDLYAVAFRGAGAFTMEDQSLSLLDDLRILQGSVSLATGTLSVGGSFTATGGTFAHASGTILFNSSDAGEIINPGNSNFYNVVINGIGGGWTMQASATTTNNFSLTSASSYTQTSGTVLYVGNVFTNNVGGAATNWNGSTLVLDGGSEYSINTKTTGGDRYNTLIVGNNTDIRAWNSSATTTNVAASASLYSQDHNEVNGALSIYGDFHISTTTEHWSYATDFDGTGLSGSERAVTVTIASNATTTVDGGTLNILGASGNSTTITNQGSGTYAFAVQSGTLNGLYYTYRNLNANGLQITGAPTITSLSQGDYQLAVNGGKLISVTADALNANASKVITGTRFASGGFTGTNVALTGSTSNAWTFVAHTGDLAGEDHDDDGVSECGSIRWNNSSCLLTQQTQYRWRNDDGGIDVPNSEWFNAAWDARKRVRLENPDAATYTDAVVKLTVEYDADMQIDFDDLRFTDASGTTTIPHFVERYTPSTEADVWVRVPSLAAEDITTIFMYFDNASATSTSASNGTFITADDFEDGNISEYAGDTSLMSPHASFAYGGSYGLGAVGHESDKATDGIGRTNVTVSQGEIIRFLQYVSTGEGDEVCTLFGVQSPVTANQNYAVCLEQFGTHRLSLAKDVQNTDSSGTILASSTVDYEATGEGWYEVEIDWQTNDDIEVTLSKDDALITTVSANDGSYSSGGIGFTFWFQNGGWDNYTSRPRVDTEPTVYFGAKQTDGGASWKGDRNAPASYVPGDIARLRLAVENSGLQITGQTFDLEFASKNSAPSCEAVADEDYVIVPPQSSCGTSALCMQSSSFITDNSATTDLLDGTDGTFTPGKVIENPSNTTVSLTLDQDTYTELEYAITPTVYANSPSYCLRVTDGGDELDTYLSVAEFSLRFDPVVTNVSINGGADISLVPGATTTVYATGTVTDLNGYTDIFAATSTLYRSGVAGGASCTPDNNSCYISTDSLCSFTSCAGSSCTVSCSADLYFHADATDVSPFEGEEWLAAIEVRDQDGGIDIGSPASGVEVLSLPALNVTSAISYGALEVASTTGSYNPTTTIQNLGNIPINIRVEGTDLTDGGSSVIPTSEQKFATSTFTYTACPYCSTVSSSTPVDLEVDLSKPTSAGAPVTDIVYWGIEIPVGTASNPHSGTNIFYAIGETP